MIYSMTGYGRASGVRNGREITVELRSVNARYFEYSSRIPRNCAFMDSRLKAQLNKRIAPIRISIEPHHPNTETAGAAVAADLNLARSYQQLCGIWPRNWAVKNDVTVSLLAKFPDVLTTRQAQVNEDQLWEDVSDVTAQALESFVEMRGIEGAKMLADISGRLDTVEECGGARSSLSAGRVEQYTQRLYERLKTILEDRNIDDARVLTEAAIFGDKTAVDEETVRLRSHIAPVPPDFGQRRAGGPQADFLTQELNRESNTIGSKCQDLDITRIVVDMKAEIEKIREQIQTFGVRTSDETDQHRIWQYGQRRAAGGGGEP